MSGAGEIARAASGGYHGALQLREARGGASHLLWAQRPQSSRVSAIATHPYKGEIGASCPLFKMGKLGAVGFAAQKQDPVILLRSR